MYHSQQETVPMEVDLPQLNDNQPAPLCNLSEEPLDLSIRPAVRTQICLNAGTSVRREAETSRFGGDEITSEIPGVSQFNTRAESSFDPDLYRRTERDRLRANRDRVTARRSLFRVAFNYDPSQFENLSHHDIGGMSGSECRFCRALLFRDESKNMCCSGGKVRVPALACPPEPVASLFDGEHEESRHFLKNIRLYNSCFQMTSFGTTAQASTNPGWNPTFRICGQVYHAIGSIHPLQGLEPCFFQIYFMGSMEAQIDRRTGLFRGLRRHLVAVFQQLLDQNNSLIRQFRTAVEHLPSENHRLVICADQVPDGEHVRRFNEPTVDEVAIAIVQDDDQASHRDVLIRARDNKVFHISELHPSYDALQYPIIFWKGQKTWSIHLKHVDPESGAPARRSLTTLEYYCYHFMVRNGSVNFLLKCGQLFGQFVVDEYAKIESGRLSFLRNNQKQLRADSYNHFRDHMLNEGLANQCGQRVILPSTFVGGPRHMHQYYQDAMTYIRKFGCADLFITFTCNPKWKEISDNLFPGQTASDRYDIVSRVFKLKLRCLMDALVKDSVFGSTRAHLYTVEWQKRGLPHAHILIWLEERLRPDNIDQIISAELPDPVTDPILHEIVTTNMIHGPCGALDPTSVCMKDRLCTKRFPKPFCIETQVGEDGFPLYRRRSPQDGGGTFLMRRRNHEFLVDNSWIVPYSPYLLREFNAHINVEPCMSHKSIKYLCKYINKGSDMAFVSVRPEDRYDEIKQYQLARYICISEALWRCYEFPIHERFPPVTQLHVHLENEQRVQFDENNAQLLIHAPPDSTLTAFFSLCRRDPFAKGLLYHEVPTFYTWNKSKRTFEGRKQGSTVEGHSHVRRSNMIGRMYTVHPSNKECFFLRLLLNHVRGPESFEDLRSFEGRVCGTYREACELRGLLESDNHWEKTLADAVLSGMPSQLRTLFSIILCECSPSDPNSLWMRFREDLSEDLLHQQRMENPALSLGFSEAIFNQSLIRIEDICLRLANKSLRDLGLTIEIDRATGDIFNSDLLRETNYDLEEQAQYVLAREPILVPDQRHAYSKIVEAVSRKDGRGFFLDAPGGTGKTFVLNLILARIRREGKIAIACASSGIASTLLTGGRTAHSTFKLPVDIHKTDAAFCSISKNSNKAEMLRRCDIVIWDECTMSHKKMLETLDRSLRDIRNSERPFGGLVVVLAGDFRQTLPVIQKSTQADSYNACLKRSYLWRHFETLSLRTNMRVSTGGGPEAQAFANLLLSLGDGIPPFDSSSLIEFPLGFCNIVSQVNELVDRVYPDINTNFREHDWLAERAILAPLNSSVNDLNLAVQDRLVSPSSRQYLSIDTPLIDQESDQAAHIPIEILNEQEPSGFPPHRMNLKVGSVIILLRNLDPPKLCNGTRMIIKTLRDNVIESIILSGPFKGSVVFIPRIPLKDSESVLPFKRLQFPIRLAFAMTINKAQGQSLKVAGVDLTSPCFAHGQLYVACSRVGSPSNLHILAPGSRTKNVVIKQALR